TKSERVSRKTKSGKEKSPDKDDEVGTREEGDGASADGKVSPEWTKAQAEKQGGTEPVSEKPNGSGEVTFGHQCPRVSAHARLGPRDPGGDAPAAKESDGSRGATAGKSKEEKGSGIRDYEKAGFIGCRPKEPRNSARAPNASIRPESPQQHPESDVGPAESPSNGARPTGTIPVDEELEVRTDPGLISWIINDLHGRKSSDRSSQRSTPDPPEPI